MKNLWQPFTQYCIIAVICILRIVKFVRNQLTRTGLVIDITFRPPNYQYLSPIELSVFISNLQIKNYNNIGFAI